MRTRLILATLLALIAVPRPAGAAAPYAGHDLQRFSFREPHMGTTFEIILYAPDEAHARRAAQAGFARVAELNAIMSDYLPTSELMKLCARAGSGPVKVSDDLFRVLSHAHQVAACSGGAFDVTVGPVVRLWRQARKTRKLPSAEALAAARKLVGTRMVKLDPDARTVELLTPGMQLDLGGIGKGYAADAVHAVLKAHGVNRALVAAGGDITVSHPPPGRAGWTVAVARLPGETAAARFVLANASVSTSGDAEQFTEIAGTRYSHIVDPRTGLGLVGRMSATVVAPTGVQADALTKVVAILGAREGFAVLNGDPGVHARFVRRLEDDTLETATTADFPKR